MMVLFAISGLDDVDDDEPAGVSGGKKFTDGPTSETPNAPNGPITAIRVWVDGENYTSGIQVEYGNDWGESHGGSEGEMIEITLSEEETLDEVLGSIGEKGIQSLKFISSLSDYGPYGGEIAENPKFASEKEGCYVIYISGRVDNDRIDLLDFHYKCDV